MWHQQETQISPLSESGTICFATENMREMIEQACKRKESDGDSGMIL